MVVREQISDVVTGLVGVSDELREMSRGIHPAILSKGGLGPALRTLARRSTAPVDLEIAVPRRLPDYVEVAGYYVVAEALTNVAKHAQASQVHLAVKTESDYLYLSIRDDGIGGADAGKGSGLIGLVDRVEALGGRISITSHRGDGTSLDVMIPLRRDALSSELVPRETWGLVLAGMPTVHLLGDNGVVESQLKAIRVVIVDDNSEFLDSARRLLEHQGVRVVGVASTNADGLRRVQELRPDVTLVDVNLGEESGFDLAEALQESDDEAPVPVILISTHAEPDLADMLETSPAIGFLAKSALSADAITATVGRLGESHRQ
jgi:CheY-like chemotaxis protein